MPGPFLQLILLTLKTIKMDLQTLTSAQNELARFDRKLKDAIKAMKTDPSKTGTKATAAVKRAAMDLKNELHKITTR